MARTTPDDYYHAFVYGNFWDYEQQPDDIRRGLNACVSASQLADIVIAYYDRENPAIISRWKKATVRLSIRELRIDLCRREPHSVTIQSAATAYKHLHTRGAQYDMNTAGSMENVTVSPVGTMDVSYGDPDVIVHRRDGSHVSLKAALTAVVDDLWPTILRELRA